ncbi:transposase [Aquibacillus albus]|uniref:Transposase n=1 Tax=Aquibacillus albus TaxID=1168171 RepID=A0ABS2MVJ9_9BACI|nr:transposase [Aquibacillus albus]
METRDLTVVLCIHLTNGYIEGINNTIKVLKRDSFGIKNFQRLKHKIRKVVGA